MASFDGSGNISVAIATQAPQDFSEDNLTSVAANRALSANQGRVLNEKISTIAGYFEGGSAKTAKSANVAMIAKKLEDSGTIGSVYTSIRNVNPIEIFGGRWDLVFEGKDVIPVGSQVILSEFRSDKVGDTPVLGAYGNLLLEGIFENVNRPNGYGLAFRFSASCTTSAAGETCLKINGKVVTDVCCTFSYDSFRRIMSGPYFAFSDFVQQTTLHYQGPGLNLQVGFSRSQVHGPEHPIGGVVIRDVTVHGAFMSKDKIYKWQRVA
jgi:hypothetical protein